jgi:hypothetical protein
VRVVLVLVVTTGPVNIGRKHTTGMRTRQAHMSADPESSPRPWVRISGR